MAEAEGESEGRIAANQPTRVGKKEVAGGGDALVNDSAEAVRCPLLVGNRINQTTLYFF